jgi:hypothetical protein
MSAIELTAMRKEVANEILIEKDEVLLMKIIDFIRKSKRTAPPPCQFSVKELKAEILKSEDDFKNGQYVTMEYMRTKHPRI